MTSRWPAMSASLASINDIGDVSITSAAQDDALEYNGTSWVNRVPVRNALNGEPTGFPNITDTTLAASVSVGAGGSVTLAKVGTDFDIWADATRYTKSADEVFTIPATTGLYFCKYDSTGVASASTTPWSILTDVPVAFLYYNDTTGDYFLGEERHGTEMDAATHYRLHFGGGAVWYSGFAASGYVLGSDTLADVQIAIDAGTFGDEDITLTLTAKAEGDNWDKWYREGATGPWRKTAATDTIPAFHASNVPKINQDTGGGTWALVSVTNNYYFNVYVVATNSYETANRFVLIPGQSDYANSALAEAEELSSLDLGDLPSPEIIPIYKIQCQYKTSYTGNNARIEIIDVEDLRGTNNPGVAASVTTHNSLGGRADANAHPSQAIATTDVTLAGQLDSTVETNLGLALGRLDDFGYVPVWATGLVYRIGNVVKQDHKTFYCLTAHTAAASFDTDNAAGYWSMIGNGGLANKVQTTDATETTISSQTVPSNVACSVIVRISAFEPATGDSKAWALEYHIKNVGGTCTANRISERAYEDAGATAWAAACDFSGTTFRVRVTGEAAHTINWNATCEHSYF